MRQRPRGDGNTGARIGAGGALLVCGLWLEAAGAAELQLSTPSACVTRDELAFRVERAIDSPLADAPPLAFRVKSVEKTVEKAPRSFRAELEISAPIAADSGSRTFVAASCQELMDRIALAMALALGSRGDEEALASPTEAALASVPVAAAEPAPEAAAQAKVDAERGPSARFVARAGVLADTGTLPRAGLGVGGGAGLRWPSFELVALGMWLPRREGSVDPSVPDSPGARVGLVGGSLLGCAPLGTPSAPVELGVCAGWELGRLEGNGTHVDEARHQASLWSAARLDLRAEWLLAHAPLGLALSLGAVAPLTRDEFIVKDIGSVYRPASVVGRASLGLLWAL